MPDNRLGALMLLRADLQQKMREGMTEKAVDECTAKVEEILEDEALVKHFRYQLTRSA